MGREELPSPSRTCAATPPPLRRGGTVWAELFRHGVVGLGITPEAFWRLSWREWQMLNSAPEVVVLGRQGLEDLMRAFPDE